MLRNSSALHVVLDLLAPEWANLESLLCRRYSKLFKPLLSPRCDVMQCNERKKRDTKIERFHETGARNDDNDNRPSIGSPAHLFHRQANKFEGE